MKSHLFTLASAALAGFMPHRRLPLALALTMLGGSALDALAVEPPWPTEPQPYVVIDQELKDVLTEFAHQTGTPITIDPAVKGRVRGSWPSLTPRGFIKEMATRQGFTLYYDGERLNITPADSTQSRVISLGRVNPEKLTAALDRLGV